TSVFMAVSSIDDGVTRLIEPHAALSTRRKIARYESLRVISTPPSNTGNSVAMGVPAVLVITPESAADHIAFLAFPSLSMSLNLRRLPRRRSHAQAVDIEIFSRGGGTLDRRLQHHATRCRSNQLSGARGDARRVAHECSAGQFQRPGIDDRSID